MAKLTGPLLVHDEDTTVVDTTAKYPFLTRGYGEGGGEYIYLAGAASRGTGNVVVYTPTGAVTRVTSTTGSPGPAAVAGGAINSTVSSGWYQIYGVGAATVGVASITNAQVYTTATAGMISTTDVATAFIAGVFTTAAGDAVGTTGTVAIHLQYPYRPHGILD